MRGALCGGPGEVGSRLAILVRNLDMMLRNMLDGAAEDSPGSYYSPPWRKQLPGSRVSEGVLLL